MRRRLLLVILAVTTLLVAAFALPLAILVRDVARDRAITAAERDLAAIAPVFVVDPDAELLELALQRTESGRDGRLSAWLADGTRLGGEIAPDADAVALARERRLAFSRDYEGGVALYTPVLVGEDDIVVLRVRVPDASLTDGVAGSWAILAAVALGLVALAVLAGDRLGRTVTKPAAELAATSRTLASGDTSARAAVAGPPEIADVAEALNLLAARIDELLAAERERVADLSHRLRTPLTALRLGAESQPDRALLADIERLEAEVDELIRAARRPLHESVVERCDLSEVVADRSAFWGALAEDDGREWSCTIEPPGPHHVRWSRAEAAAVVDVLLGNVFAHTPEGVPYTVAVEAADAGVALRVEDGGPGVGDPDAALHRGASGGGSTGLGLDIARSAAEAVGGSLRIGRSSTLGGAQVVLTLPSADA